MEAKEMMTLERDLDLVRDLMLLIESNDGRSVLDIPESWDRKVVAYHLKILDQAGYVENKTRWADDEPWWIMASLNWDGHEFLDSVKNNNVWEKTKTGVKNKGFELATVPFDVLKELAIVQLKNMLGI